jgi:acetyl esterase/lipase
VTLAAALVLAFLTCWIVLPPFHAVLLPLAVGAPEVSPALSVAGIVLALLSAVRARGNRRRRWSCTIALAGTAVAASPVVRSRPVTRSFDAAMRDALGPDALAAPAPEQTWFRRSPLSVRDAVLGLKFGSAPARRDIRFATAAGVDLMLDVYQPAAAGVHPAVVQVYGGAWQRGSPHDDGRFAAHLASLGYVVFAIDYRHAPQWKWPAQMTDLRAALEWIRVHGADYRADVSRVAMIGRSAGAHLALMAAYDSPAVPIRAVVNLYGPTDLEDGYRRPPRPDPFDVRAIEEALLGGTPDQVPQQYRDASPITHVSTASPPTLSIYGSRDHIVHPRYGTMLHERLRRAGVKSVLLEIPWAEHAFDLVPNGPSAQIALYYTERFLARTLKP